MLQAKKAYSATWTGGQLSRSCALVTTKHKPCKNSFITLKGCDDEDEVDPTHMHNGKYIWTQQKTLLVPTLSWSSA